MSTCPSRIPAGLRCIGCTARARRTASRPYSCTQHTTKTCNMQHAAYDQNMQHATCSQNMQRAACTIRATASRAGGPCSRTAQVTLRPAGLRRLAPPRDPHGACAGRHVRREQMAASACAVRRQGGRPQPVEQRGRAALRGAAVELEHGPDVIKLQRIAERPSCAGRTARVGQRHTFPPHRRQAKRRSPGAECAAVSPVPMQTWAGVSPVPVQM